MEPFTPMVQELNAAKKDYFSLDVETFASQMQQKKSSDDLLAKMEREVALEFHSSRMDHQGGLAPLHDKAFLSLIEERDPSEYQSNLKEESPLVLHKEYRDREGINQGLQRDAEIAQPQKLRDISNEETAGVEANQDWAKEVPAREVRAREVLAREVPESLGAEEALPLKSSSISGTEAVVLECPLPLENVDPSGDEVTGLEKRTKSKVKGSYEGKRQDHLLKLADSLALNRGDNLVNLDVAQPLGLSRGELERLVGEIVAQIDQMQTEDLKETGLVLQGIKGLEGAKIAIKEFKSAPKEYNITFSDLTVEGQKKLEQGIELLRVQMKERGILVQMIETNLAPLHFGEVQSKEGSFRGSADHEGSHEKERESESGSAEEK
jgi:hypothetical protein